MRVKADARTGFLTLRSGNIQYVIYQYAVNHFPKSGPPQAVRDAPAPYDRDSWNAGACWTVVKKSDPDRFPQLNRSRVCEFTVRAASSQRCTLPRRPRNMRYRPACRPAMRRDEQARASGAAPGDPRSPGDAGREDHSATRSLSPSTSAAPAVPDRSSPDRCGCRVTAPPSGISAD